MINEDSLKALLMEDQYPTLSDEQIEYLCGTFSNINQAAYMGCMMKAKSDKITVGPISIENDASYWMQMAQMFYLLWQNGDGVNSGTSRSITGKCVGRADE